MSAPTLTITREIVEENTSNTNFHDLVVQIEIHQKCTLMYNPLWQLTRPQQKELKDDHSECVVVSTA